MITKVNKNLNQQTVKFGSVPDRYSIQEKAPVRMDRLHKRSDRNII